MKRVYIIILTLFLPFIVKAGNINLTGTTSLSPGEETTLSVVVSSNDKICGGQAVINLSNENFEIDYSKTTSSYQILAKTNGFSIMSTDKAIPNKGTIAKIKVKAKSNATVGETAELNLKKIVYTVNTVACGGDYMATLKEENVNDYSITLTVAEPKSDNNYLSDLKIEGYEIEFDKETLTYNIDIPEGTTSLKVTGTAEDEKASVKVSGNTSLKEGENTISVVVTAENGTKKTYKIIAKAPNKNVDEVNTDCDLKTLTIKGYNIDFDPNKTVYYLNVKNEVEKVEIETTLVNTESSKQTAGPEKLNIGENEYIIVVTSKDGKTKKYTITVNREKAEKECEVCECEPCEPKEERGLWKILAIILLIVALAETIYMITLRDKKQL